MWNLTNPLRFSFSTSLTAQPGPGAQNGRDGRNVAQSRSNPFGYSNPINQKRYMDHLRAVERCHISESMKVQRMFLTNVIEGRLQEMRDLEEENPRPRYYADTLRELTTDKPWQGEI